MRHAISYVSTANPNLNKKDVANLFKEVNEFNKNHDITGVLLFAETNFFQLIEGEKKEIMSLYSRIKNDSRHNNIIKFVDRHVKMPAFFVDISIFVTDTTKLNSSNLKIYLNQIDDLVTNERRAVKRVRQSISGQ